MTWVATIGLDIGNSVFQVHGVDAAGQVVVRRRLTRGRILMFFEKLAPCSLGSRPAAARITGPENLPHAGTRSA